MSFARRSFFPSFLVALWVGLSSCSSTPSGGEASGNPDIAPESDTPQSGADAVGSAPEDMLTDETGGEAAQQPSPDPFADLGDGKAAEAGPVTEPSEGAMTTDDQASSASSGKVERYTVRAGDTLMKIAFHLYGDVDRWKDLLELNQGALKDGSSLRKGMKLRYEAPSEPFTPEELAHAYQIKKGDTLAGIADEVYGRKAKYRKLQTYNRRLIKNPNRIFAGFTLFYEITEQEMAEAEARRAQRAAGMPSSAPALAAPPLPSALSPPSAPPAPSAADNSGAGLGPASPAGGEVLPGPVAPSPPSGPVAQ